MVKSLLLLCCTFLSLSLLAQVPRADTTLPQKLQIKKIDLLGADPLGVDHLTFMTKKMPATGGDSVRSLMYEGPARRDSFQLQLPAMKNINAGIQIKAGHHESLFRRE